MMIPSRRNFFDEVFDEPIFSKKEAKMMKTDIKEKDGNYIFTIDVPGFEKENIKSKMLLQVHDELIFNVYDDEIDKVKEIVYNTMTNVFDLKVPLDVDIELGNNWYEAK